MTKSRFGSSGDGAAAKALPEWGAGLPEPERQALERIARVATDLAGVQLGARQMSMVESRVQKRLRELGLTSFAQYLAYVDAHRAAESTKIVSMLTTHHTYFFREFAHFEHLAEKALPALVAAARAQGRRRLRVWSAACSRGQEAYSLAMWLEAHLPRIAPDFEYEILGTDVDPESVAAARNGVYRFDELKEVPMSLLGGHWARGTAEISDFIKAKASLRKRCRFEVGNLLQVALPATEKFDVVFCRNVFIYFRPDQVARAAADLLARLEDHGFLYVGISESLHGLSLGARAEGPSIYRKAPKAEALRAVRPAPASEARAPKALDASPPRAEPARPVRVFNVDDSPVILKLLSQIFSKDAGFEIAGQAANGVEAAAKLKVAGHVDVMTLDIHMPEQDGVAYLRANMKPGHPAVVMVTSVSRESSGLALEALSLGAADFVEKPALANLAARTEEIRTKIKWAAKSKGSSAELSLDRQVNDRAADSVPRPESALRVLFVGGVEALRRAMETAGAACGPNEPPLLIAFDGEPGAVPKLRAEIERRLGKPALDEARFSFERSGGPKPGDFAAVDWSTGISKMTAATAKGARVSAMAFGDPSPNAGQSLASALGSTQAQLILEDLGLGKGASSLQSLAHDVTPATSFIYLSTAYLCGRKSSN